MSTGPTGLPPNNVIYATPNQSSIIQTPNNLRQPVPQGSIVAGRSQYLGVPSGSQAGVINTSVPITTMVPGASTLPRGSQVSTGFVRPTTAGQ